MSWKAGRPRILTASGPTIYWPAKICSSVDLPAGGAVRPQAYQEISCSHCISWKLMSYRASSISCHSHS